MKHFRRGVFLKQGKKSLWNCGGFNQQQRYYAAEHLKGMYFDTGATTPMDPRVLDKMLPVLTEQYGNAHSRTHEYGRDSEKMVEDARAEVAKLIGAQSPKEIVFTSGATESNNLALKGAARYLKKRGKNHIITLATEHKCVIDSCICLQDEGFDVTFLPVQKNGIVDMEKLQEAITDKTCLISVMMVNNEIGVLQPIKEIGQICKKNKILFHTDAAQAVGKIPVDVEDMNIDIMSISGHKIYGPKGIGALYVRRRRPRVRLTAMMSGGKQERGMRSGTLPAPLCIGLGEACRVAREELQRDTEHVNRLSKRLIDGLMELDEIVINGSEDSNYPGVVNISFAFVEGEALLMQLNTAALSSGSACTSASLEPSYVLRALGVSEELAHTSLRFGIGRFTTEEEVDYLISETKRSVEKLRSLSPLFHMHKQGIDISSIDWTASAH